MKWSTKQFVLTNETFSLYNVSYSTKYFFSLKFEHITYHLIGKFNRDKLTVYYVFSKLEGDQHYKDVLT